MDRGGCTLGEKDTTVQNGSNSREDKTNPKESAENRGPEHWPLEIKDCNA